MKQILILIIFLLINTNSFADKRFEKDLKKISKLNSFVNNKGEYYHCLLYTSPSPRDKRQSRMPSSA